MASTSKEADMKPLLREIQEFLKSQNSAGPDGSEKAYNINKQIMQSKYARLASKKLSLEIGEAVHVEVIGMEHLQIPVNLQFVRSNPTYTTLYKEVMDDLQLFFGAWVVNEPILKQKHSMKHDSMLQNRIGVGSVQNVYKRIVILRKPEPEDPMVLCYLPDEGQNAALRIDEIYFIPRHFAKYPAQVFQFHLEGTSHFVNSTNFQELLKYQLDLTGKLTATILSAETASVYTVSLSSPKYPGQTINNIVLQHLFHIYDPRIKFPMEGVTHPEVYVSHADDAGNVFISLPNPADAFLDEILEKISGEEFARKSGVTSLPSRFTLCITRENNRNFRNFCIDQYEDLVRVVNIDHGDEREVKLSDIALASHFDPNLRMIRPQAYMAHLNNVAKMGGTVFMASWDFGNPVKMKVIRRPKSVTALPEVELIEYCNGSGAPTELSINEQVLTSFHGVRTVSQTYLDLQDVPRSLSFPFEGLSVIPRRGRDWGNGGGGPFVEFTKGSVIHVIVTKIEDTGELYIQPANLTVDISTLIDQFRNQEFTRVNPNNENKCGCIMDGKFFTYTRPWDGSYGRCTVIKNIFSNQKFDLYSDDCRVGIFDVDLQEFMFVSTKAIQRLEPELARIPPQGARVILVYPDELNNYYAWTRPEWEEFKKYALGRRFQMEIMMLPLEDWSGLRTGVTLMSENGAPLHPETGFWKAETKPE